MDHVLRREDNEVSQKCQKKDNLIQNVWNNVGENLIRKSNMILSKMTNPLSVTVMDNDIIDTKFFENPMEHKKQSIDRPCDYKMQEKKSLDVIDTADKNVQSVDTWSILMDYNAIWAYNENEKHQIDEIRNIDNSTETMGSNNVSKNNNAMESQTLYIPEATGSNSTDNSCAMDVDLTEYTDSDKEKLKRDNEETVHRNIDTDEDASMSAESFCMISESNVPQFMMDSTKGISMSTRLSNAYQKIFKVINPFRTHISSGIAVKRSKLDSTMECRQFGHSVTFDASQTSHRRQHKVSHNYPDMEIQDDHDTRQNVENYHAIQGTSSRCYKPLHADGCDVTDDARSIKQTCRPFCLSPLLIIDKLSIEKEMRQKVPKFLRDDSSDSSDSSDSTIISEESSSESLYFLDSKNSEDSKDSKDSEDSEDSEKGTFLQDISRKSSITRLRLLSDSSIDSNDSFCILFESESKEEKMIDSDESDFTDQNGKNNLVIDNKDNKDDTINEDDENESETSTQARKVFKNWIML